LANNFLKSKKFQPHTKQSVAAAALVVAAAEANGGRGDVTTNKQQIHKQ
jgi:hypothetical protein